MALYALTVQNSIVRTNDGAAIPTDLGNKDYAAYLAWKAAGGVPDPYVAPVLTQAQAAVVQLGTTAQVMIGAIDIIMDLLLVKKTVLLTDIPEPIRSTYVARKTLRQTAGLP